MEFPCSIDLSGGMSRSIKEDLNQVGIQSLLVLGYHDL